MRALTAGRTSFALKFITLCATLLLGAGAAFGQAQSTAADLTGTVRDPNNASVPNATVTARNTATNLTRTVQSGSDGTFQLIGLPPGNYEVTAEAASFAKTTITEVVLTVGQSAQLDVPLQIGSVGVTLDVTAGDVALVETTSTTVANTIDQARIQNLPINQRDATGFALTISTVGRDNGRPIGPAPTSGLNIGGQRGRSTLVQVDGSDFTDNSVNASRSTVSQEAVQEYQVATNSYAPEFGRAIGGIVNVVTKSGTNEYNGNVFGYIRHKSIQARNAFAPLVNNDPDEKPPYTRAQYGGTFGGPIVRDRTFFFASFEQRKRQESGFFTSDVIGPLTSNLSVGAPFLPFTTNFTNITAAQRTFISNELASGDAARINRAITYGYFASSGGQIGLNGTSSLVSPGGAIQAGTVIGSRFFLSGAPVPLTRNANGQYIAFRPLNQLQRLFPISEDTTFFSVRGDHRFNNNNNLTLRFSYNPSDLTGIQDESQNQTLGQNDFSRTGIQTLRDTSFSASLSSILSSNVINEAYFTFGRRRATFDSQIPSVAQQISGVAFIGSNPFSPVDRTEKRYQFRDNINVVAGNHTFKFGGDINYLDINARFELNFPALFNISSVSASTLGAGFIPGLSAAAPDLTPVQAYGLGFPSAFIQGFGNPNSRIKNKPLAFFAQDTWKIRPNLTFNYGVRYDVELTDTLAPVSFTDPLTGTNISADTFNAAETQFNIQQGFPRDKNNFAPRVGVAYDINSDGKTVLRAAYGIFYDHPLLAVAFNSDIADDAQQQQYTNVLPGSPAPNQLLNIIQIFQGTAVPGVTPGLAASARYLQGQQRFDSANFVGFGPVFPFSLPVSRDFEYAYANQVNLAVERQITKTSAFSASYLFVGAHHLPHPQDLNAPQTDLLIENFRRFAGIAPPSVTAAFVGISIPTSGAPCVGAPTLQCYANPLNGQQYAIIVPGLVTAPLANLNSRVVLPIAANFFRPSGPNYFFAQSVTGGAVTPAVLNSALPGSVRTPGLVVPFGDVNAQLSDGNSNYNALNLELKNRFSSNFQFLVSYTYAHSIDDSSDLQTLLKPQNNRNFRAERADSLFDQRHRFVLSGFITAPSEWRSSDRLLYRFLNGFTVAPILELSAGRPFNIITNTDRNGDQQGSNERPSVAGDGTLLLPTFFTDGTLGRNRGITHGYASLDLGVTRAIRFNERVRLDVIGQVFNLFNRFNEAAANPFFDVVNTFGERNGGKYYSRPTAAFDPRQFQFGLKLYF